ncbi:MAG TPA: ubiquinol-cytochrome c reductase iron-sulfur subunit [Coleofasciculaceae cyanobacterium]|jgi:cytochrome b6-f complex iron-sulfur subunit
MKRRTFFDWAGIGLLASYFPVALATCSQTKDDSNTTAQTTSNSSSTEEFVSLGTVEELESTGYLLNKESQVLVVKDSEDGLWALNPTCTHQGCIVEWESATNTLLCPCHNAKYAANGKVLAKPAPEPLAVYKIKQENSEILVKVSS